MAIPQGTVNFQMALGKPGEQAFDMPPVSAQTRFIHSGADTNYFGYAYTETTYTATQGSGVAPKSAQVGGTGVFAGILVQPNAVSSTGVTGDPLGTNYKLADDSFGELANTGCFFIDVAAACNIGDDVIFSQTTGRFATVAPGADAGAGNTKVAGAHIYGYSLAAAGIAVAKFEAFEAFENGPTIIF